MVKFKSKQFLFFVVVAFLYFCFVFISVHVFREGRSKMVNSIFSGGFRGFCQKNNDFFRFLCYRHSLRSICSIRVNSARHSSRTPKKHFVSPTLDVGGETYVGDSWTNVTPKIISKIGVNLHNRKYHPINLIRLRIQDYFYKNFLNRLGNPIFSVFDNISPVVTTYQNFDSLLTPEDHPSRSKSDTYYINRGRLLRGHTSAHQEELVKMGFDAFLLVGDVYRRDDIDHSHYPVFHQMEGVRLFSERQVGDLLKLLIMASFLISKFFYQIKFFLVLGQNLDLNFLNHIRLNSDFLFFK